MQSLFSNAAVFSLRQQAKKGDFLAKSRWILAKNCSTAAVLMGKLVRSALSRWFRN